MASSGDFSNSKEGSGTTQSDVFCGGIEFATIAENPVQKQVCERICRDHPEENIFFCCRDHQVDCCAVCIANSHTECSTVAFEEIAFKLTTHIGNVKQVHQNISNAEDNLRAYLRVLEKHLYLGEKKIKTFYDEIRKKVDEAENMAVNRFAITKQQKLSKVASHFNDYDKLKKQISSILEEAERLNNIHRTQCDTVFHSDSEVLEKSELCDQPNRDLDSHKADSMFDIHKHTLAHEDEMKNIQNKLSELSKVVTNTDMNFVNKNSQHLSSIELSLSKIVNFTSSMTSTPVKQFVKDTQITCEGSVRSMVTLPTANREMFIITHNPHKLLHINSQSGLIKNVDLPNVPYDMCMHGFNIAVSFLENKIICYRSSDFGANATHNLPGGCCGVCRVGDIFVVSFCYDGVVKGIDDSGKIVTASDKLFKYPTIVRFATDSNCIFVSDENQHQVVALNPDLRTILFKMSHTDLQTTTGICINEWGGIYVCSFSKHCVVEFSKEGKYVKTILPADQLAISCPFSILYDAASKLLYVASQSKTIHVFKGQ